MLAIGVKCHLALYCPSVSVKPVHRETGQSKHGSGWVCQAQVGET